MVIVIATIGTLQFVGPFRRYPSKGKTTPHPTIAQVRIPTQPGKLVYQKNGYKVDYSNADLGYISVIGPDDGSVKKVQLIIGNNTYTYDITAKQYTILPLQSGSGKYTVQLLKNLSGNSYTVVGTTIVSANVTDELSVFLYPNQVVDYNLHTLAVNKSFEITKNDDSEIKRVYTIYHYVIDLLSYDTAKAKLANDVYMLPVLDTIVTEKKGICFDYAALMTAMLRVQGIPTRLITGYTDLGYHAWVEIYLRDIGWINPRIYFKEKIWKRVDPTFDDSFGIYMGKYQTKYTY
ncbi:MAG: transglutaminase domain-containing protein [Erysipelotrichaceae bacterium]